MRKKEAGQKIYSQALKTQVPSLNMRSPRKIEPYSSPKKLKPVQLRTDVDSEIFGMSDRQEILLLQIKQLKCQNSFLRKRIGELNGDLGLKSQSKRGKQKQKRTLSSIFIESLPLSVNVVFEEINDILSTIMRLFRVEFGSQEKKKFQNWGKESIQIKCPIQKQLIFKRDYLKQKLEKIMLETQQNRYPLLIDLFTDYYTVKEQSERKTIQAIDQLSVKAHQLNQTLLNKVEEKIIRRTFSNIQKEEEVPISTLKVPIAKNFIAQNKAMAHSPLGNRNNRKTSRLPTSPGAKGRIPEL